MILINDKWLNLIGKLKDEDKNNQNLTMSFSKHRFQIPKALLVFSPCTLVNSIRKIMQSSILYLVTIVSSNIKRTTEAITNESTHLI